MSSTPTPLRLGLRFPRLFVAGYAGVVEVNLETLDAEVPKNIVLELRCDALENGVAEWRGDEMDSSSMVVPVSLRVQKAGVFPLEVRLVVGTARGQLTAQGHQRAGLNRFGPAMICWSSSQAAVVSFFLAVAAMYPAFVAC